MRSHRSPFWIALSIGSVVGVGYPLVDLAIACRAPTSEACIWGKAYLLVTMGASVVLLGGVVTGLAYAVLRWLRRRSD